LLTVQRKYEPDKALSKIEAYCVYQERSQQEVRDKLYSWGLHRNEVENLISNLIGNGFIKEERFASAFAGGKFRIKKWGRNKIKMALKSKSVSDPLIKKAISEIDDREYEKTLRQIIDSKSKLVTEKNPFKRKQKIASYAISKGFEPELVWRLLKADDDVST
jgi:regulatory protein